MNLRPGRPLAIQIALACFMVAAHAQDANNKDANAKDDSMRDCPMHKQHTAAQTHHATVERHGDQAMGFPHDQTTHHFLLGPDGGAIEVTANDPADNANSVAIRTHLSQIAVAFGNGDFSQPMFIHDGLPPA